MRDFLPRAQLSSEPQPWKFHVVARQTTSVNCTKKRVARAARLFFLIQPIKYLFCGVAVAVAVVISQFPYQLLGLRRISKCNSHYCSLHHFDYFDLNLTQTVVIGWMTSVCDGTATIILVSAPALLTLIKAHRFSRRLLDWKAGHFTL